MESISTDTAESSKPKTKWDVHVEQYQLRKQIFLFYGIAVSIVLMILGVFVAAAMYMSAQLKSIEHTEVAKGNWPSFENLMINPSGGVSTESIVALSDYCSQILGPCFYSVDKFLPGCQTMTCQTAETFVYYDEKDQKVKVNRTPEVETVVPPNFSPCLINPDKEMSLTLFGVCQNKLCVDDPKYRSALSSYDELPPLDGGWAPLDDSCVTVDLNMSAVNTHSLVVPLQEMSECQKNRPYLYKCNPYTLVHRSCINPLPARGGRLCWDMPSDHDTDLPFVLGLNCPGCPVVDSGDPCLLAINCSSIPVHRSFEPSGSQINDFFKTCCFRQRPEMTFNEGRRGKCLLGHCLPEEMIL